MGHLQPHEGVNQAASGADGMRLLLAVQAVGGEHRSHSPHPTPSVASRSACSGRARAAQMPA